MTDDKRSAALSDPFTPPSLPPKAPASIPIMMAGQALLSLRDSGYTIAAALGEVIDNSIEANANNVRLYLREVAHGRRKAVDRIATVDDGDGMSDEVLHRYLVLGFSTRYMSTTTIGKFGVGAKLAALNFGTTVDVWTRARGSSGIRHVRFDLDEARRQEEKGELVGIAPPDDAPLPGDLQALFPEGSGTMVVWSNIDRLADGTGAHAAGNLRQEIEKELARIFREFITGGIAISVNETVLLAHDPTFLREGTWADHVLSEENPDPKASRGGSQVRHFSPRVFYDGPIAVSGSKARVVITLAPPEVLRRRGMGGDALAKKLRVPENQGQISFMRLRREISYANVPNSFGTAVEDPDRFIGVEVHFSPELDSMMGVRNVKRGAEPSDDFRQALRQVLMQWIPQARKEIQEIWGSRSREEGDSAEEHERINQALAEANLTMPKSRVAEDASEPEHEQILEDLARDTGKKTPTEQREYVQKVKKYPFVIESVDFPGDDLFQITHTNQQTIIRLNTRHRFYREMYAPLRDLSRNGVQDTHTADVARRAVEAVTLLLVAYSKAETMQEHPDDVYSDLRSWWGKYTDRFMSKIKDVLD